MAEANMDAEIQATGPGWQVRMNDALREWLGKRSMS